MGKWLVIAILIFSGTGLGCLAVYLSAHSSAKKSAPVRPAFAAELVSGSGMILVRSSGRAEWQEVKMGAGLSEGDLIQTDSSGSALIKYATGTAVSIPEQTIFTVRNPGGNVMEVSVPPQFETAGHSPSPELAEDRSKLEPSGSSNGPGSQMFLQLERIVSFGRSLELVGRVEPGTSLTVNDERVDVAGDGTFKHFTNPFPASVGKGHLVLRGTDLAGRTRVLTATYDFRIGREED